MLYTENVSHTYNLSPNGPEEILQKKVARIFSRNGKFQPSDPRISVNLKQDKWQENKTTL